MSRDCLSTTTTASIEDHWDNTQRSLHMSTKATGFAPARAILMAPTDARSLGPVNLDAALAPFRRPAPRHQSCMKPGRCRLTEELRLQVTASGPPQIPGDLVQIDFDTVLDGADAS